MRTYTFIQELKYEVTFEVEAKNLKEAKKELHKKGLALRTFERPIEEPSRYSYEEVQ